MITLHNLKGGISGQIQKNLHGEDVKLLASNILKVESAVWQCLFRCRKSTPGSPKEYALFLGVFDAFQKEPFFVEFDREQTKAKLKSWVSPAETLSILDLIDSETEEK